jgi:hypothetical protein
MISKSRLFSSALAAAVLIANVAGASAQETVDLKDKLAARVSQFLEGVARGETQAAYEELLRGSQLITQTKAVEALVAKTAQIPEQYGKYRAFEPVDSKQIGSDLVLMRYLYKCENFPVVWYFTFYRTPAPVELAAENGTWRVITVRFDTRLDQLAF